MMRLRIASATASVRVATPNLDRILLTWVRAREDRQPRCGQAALTEKFAAVHATILAR